MSKVQISAFLLERYHIGEVTDAEKIQVEEALAGDDDLAASLAGLDRADSDFFQRFTQEKIFPASQDLERNHTSMNTRMDTHMPRRRLNARRLPKFSPVILGFCAAAAVLIIALPLFILKNPLQPEFSDRMKGSSADGSIIELNVYIKEDSAGEVRLLQDQADVREGKTIQLAYQVKGGASGEKYGVIFSIDGRSSVTMHFPYNTRESNLLVCGKNVPLNEAYILDDAPKYEIFFFVAADKPMDTGNILNTARKLAGQIEKKPVPEIQNNAARWGSEAFKNYEVKVFTLRKVP